jgi:YspA, cpYpsA-related SLOG family
MQAASRQIKVLVCGSRAWDDYVAIFDRLSLLPRGSTIVHGGARGADQIAARVAGRLGFQVEEFLPDWSNGKRAGLDRNLVMLDQKPDLVIAFWDGHSTGTTHTITEATKRGIPVEVFGGPSGKPVLITPAATLPL